MRPADERERLAELRSLSLLDSDPEERFDRVTRLAQRLFDVPIALVSLVDEDRQWFKSNQGLDATETPRDISICGHAILGDEILLVPDASMDPRFADNPLVLGDPGIRFYAGCPIKGPGGAKLGTLCVIDRSPRELSADEQDSLRDLAEVIEREVAVLHLASVDQLTGLANRRGFAMLASKVLEISRRQQAGASLLYLDLVGFKTINDTYGHDVGDQALAEFAHILEDAARTSDAIGRLGGDEFAVLLAGLLGAEMLRARLLRALDDRNQSTDLPYELKVSAGTAVVDPEDSDSLDELLARADTAMYGDKRRSPPEDRSLASGDTDPAGLS